MKLFNTKLIVGAALALGTIAAVAPAAHADGWDHGRRGSYNSYRYDHSRDYRYDRGRDYRYDRVYVAPQYVGPRYYGYDRYDHHNGSSNFVGGVVLGAVIGSILSH